MKLERTVEAGDGLARPQGGGLSRPKVLFICHNHWALLAGGVESYLEGVYERFGDSPDFEPYVLARAGQPFSPSDAQHPDAPLAMVGADPHQYLLYTDFSKFDYELGRLTEKDVLTRSYRDFLLALQPDLVHFQHTLYMGYDLIRITKNALPNAPLVYSLHEYIPICHRDGVMVRTLNEELCQEESPRRCHECFPQISPQTFYMRKRFIQSHMSLVDHFIAPTDYVRDRYVDWGIPAARIQVEPQGMMPVTDRVPDEASARPRNRFAFFGQLNPYKGADVLLEAMEILGPDFDGHLTIYGANLDKQGPDFKKRFGAMLEDERENVTLRRLLRAIAARRPDGRHRLGRGPLDLVGDRPDRRDGGLPVRAARDLLATSAACRRRSPTASTACTSEGAIPSSSPTSCSALPRRPAFGTSFAPASRPTRRAGWTTTSRS